MNALSELLSHTEVRDGIALILTLGGALLWLKSLDRLAYQGVIEQTLSRKIIHIGTGPLFILCWPLFSDASAARWIAAIVPSLLTLQFMAIGLGWINAPETVKSMTRTGDRREILRGPLYYGLSFILCTVVFWRTSPVGILALLILCGGDGLADIVGRRWGHHKLPFSDQKSWVGSGAMLVGSFLFGFSFLWVFNQWGFFQPPVHFETLAIAVSLLSLACTLIEAIPIPDLDNLTIPLLAIALGSLLF